MGGDGLGVVPKSRLFLLAQLNNMNISDYVYKGNLAEFSHFRSGVLYYTVQDKLGNRKMFTVPVEDLDGATVNRTEKSMALMRYIRKAIESETLVTVSV